MGLRGVNLHVDEGQTPFSCCEKFARYVLRFSAFKNRRSRARSNLNRSHT